MLQFDILSLFPGMFRSVLHESLLSRAQQQALIRVNVHDLRRYTHDRHRTADDTPYGGGAGMVMKPEPLIEAIEAVRHAGAAAQVVLLSPQGRRFDQSWAGELSRLSQLVLVCGHYEGVDERVSAYVDAELSIGDYVLTGGEVPALAVVDAVARLVPGVVGDPASIATDTLAGSLLKYPQYTRPAAYRGVAVPEVLLSGDHERIRRWRRCQSLERTRQRRPDLLAAADLTAEDREFLKHTETRIDME